MDFGGKRILLTGAAGGLGEVTAKALAEAGATLILSSRNGEKLQQIAAELPGGPHEVLAVDLTAEHAVESVISQAGEIDILIANAGRPGEMALDKTASDEIRDVVRINLEVPMQMSQAVLPQMIARGNGQIVLVASLAAKYGLSPLYSGTKGGLRMFGWALRAEQAANGVGVTVVTPGFVSEVGMFAKRGRKAPTGAGTVSPEKYVATLLKAIASNKGEVVIAPPQIRVLGQIALVAPGLFEMFFRRAAPIRRPAGE